MSDNGPPAKKRGASRQISKDDESSDSEGHVPIPLESGSFPKASEEVLASRRIVKVRRGSNPAASSGSNPFASIRLVAPASEDKVPVSIPSTNVPSAAAAEGTKATTVNDGVKPLIANATDSVNVAEEESSKEKCDDDTVTKDKEGENIEPAVDVPPRESGDSGRDGNDKETNGGYSDRHQQVVVSPKDQSKGEDEENKSQGYENNGKADENKGNDDGNKEAGEENEELGQDDSSESVAAKDNPNLPEASEDASKSTLPKGPFSFGTGAASAETPPTGFALFSSTWAFGSGSSSGSGSSTASTTTFGTGNGNVDSSSFQLFGNQASTAFSTSPAFSQPPQFQEVSVQTGEEQERVVFGGDATLFEFADKAWKERGKGEMKVNVPEDKTSKPRLVMRSKGNYKLLLNAGLFADMKLTAMDSRGVTFACVNSAVEGKTGLTTYAVKFRDSLSAGSFRDAVEAHKSGPQQQVLKTPENSPRAVHESS